MQGVTIVDHPLVQHKLTLLRDKETSTRSFRAPLPVPAARPPARHAPRRRAARHLPHRAACHPAKAACSTA